MDDPGVVIEFLGGMCPDAGYITEERAMDFMASAIQAFRSGVASMPV